MRLRVTNARTEGYNRKIKQIKRVVCGFRNQNSYERRRDRGVTITRRSQSSRLNAKSRARPRFVKMSRIPGKVLEQFKAGQF